MLTRIHINQHNIKSNRKAGLAGGTELLPVITVKRGDDNIYAHEVLVRGQCKVVYRPDKPLSCGAEVWIETMGQVIPLVKKVKVPA